MIYWIKLFFLRLLQYQNFFLTILKTDFSCILVDTQILLNATKKGHVNGNNFKCWQQEVLVVLLKLCDLSKEGFKNLTNLELANKFCVDTILNGQ